MDLFEIRRLKKLYKSRWFPIPFQIASLIIFGLLVYGAWGVSTDDMVFAKTLRNTNLSNLIIWSYWWPIIIITAILIGRHWCTICPVEPVTSLMGKIGMKRKPGKFLKSGWVITLFYAVILLIGIHTFAIHRIPQLMAVYMLILLGVSIFAGLIWEKRTFCTYICPVGHLLGLYSLLSATEWRVKNKQTCLKCKTKDCIAKNRHYKITARSCTSELYPLKIEDNRKCILCSQCLSSCPHDNLSLRVRKPLSDFYAKLKLSYAEIGFIIMVSGFVVYEVLSEWNVTKALLLAFPDSISNLFGITGIRSGTATAVILFILFPVLFFAVFTILRKIFSSESIKDSLTAIALTVLPVMGAMHLLKSFFKTTSRIPYWSYVFSDPEGVETARALIDGSLYLDKTIPLMINPFLTGIAALLPVIGFSLSVWAALRQGTVSFPAKVVTIAAALIYAAIFEVSIIAWRLM